MSRGSPLSSTSPGVPSLHPALGFAQKLTAEVREETATWSGFPLRCLPVVERRGGVRIRAGRLTRVATASFRPRGLALGDPI